MSPAYSFNKSLHIGGHNFTRILFVSDYIETPVVVKICIEIGRNINKTYSFLAVAKSLTLLYKIDKVSLEKLNLFYDIKYYIQCC